MIYEIAFGIGGISKPFNVFTTWPRKCIKIKATVDEVLSDVQTLIVEEDEGAGASDSLVFFEKITDSGLESE